MSDLNEKLTSISATVKTKNIAKEVSALRNEPVYIIIAELLEKERDRLRNCVPNTPSPEVAKGTHGE
jgi:hypothetical protein